MAQFIFLYRVMCEAEFLSLMSTGRFEFLPGGLEVTWFAETPADALRWGMWFERVSGIPHRRIVMATFDADTAVRLYREPKLDGIGPGRAATEDDLAGVGVSEWDLPGQLQSLPADGDSNVKD